MWRLEQRIIHLRTEYTIISHTSEFKCVNFLDFFFSNRSSFIHSFILRCFYSLKRTVSTTKSSPMRITLTWLSNTITGGYVKFYAYLIIANHGLLELHVNKPTRKKIPIAYIENVSVRDSFTLWAYKVYAQHYKRWCCVMHWILIAWFGELWP